LYGQSGRHWQVENDLLTVFDDPYTDQPEPIEVRSRPVEDGTGARGAGPPIGTTITICEPSDCESWSSPDVDERDRNRLTHAGDRLQQSVRRGRHDG
jgi:hypothetical protein